MTPPVCAAIEERLMMRPHLALRMLGRTRWVTRNIEVRFTRRKCSKICSVTWSGGRTWAMPALLTRMATGPSLSSTDFTMRSTSADFETSAWMATDLLADGFRSFGLGAEIYSYAGTGVG